MTERQTKILEKIITLYARSAHFVSSEELADYIRPPLSSATLRNEMLELDDEDMLFQSHTSGGRAPTPKGYKFYIEHICAQKFFEKRSFFSPQEIVALKKKRTASLKMITKKISFAMKCVAFASIDDQEVYWNGFSYIIQQPEFSDARVMIQFYEAIDEYESIIERLRAELDTLRVFVGEESLFGNAVSMLAVPVYKGNEKDLMIGIVGPLRMDYRKGLSILNSIQSLYTS